MRYQGISRRVNAVISGESEGQRLLNWVLSWFSWQYFIAVKLREYGFEQGWIEVRRLPCTVVSVGNITVGGTGKTPMVIYLAQMIHNLGYQTVVISRGYGGTAQRSGGIVSDGNRLLLEADQAGDEPRMIAERIPHVPVLIGADRYSAGIQAINRFNPEVIILDDGFQHRQLYRDIDLVLLDFQHPVGNQRILPRGPLREPISALKRAHAFVFTRSNSTPPAHHALPHLTQNRPWFKSCHQPVIRQIIQKNQTIGESMADLCADPVSYNPQSNSAVIFSGIADNRRVLQSAAALNYRIVGIHEFPDHHVWQPDDFRKIKASIIESRANLLITTAKDFARINKQIDWPVDLVVLDVDIMFNQDCGSRFHRFIKERIQKCRLKQS